MGVLTEVLDLASAQRMAILRRSSEIPRMVLYLDRDTYMRCLNDPDVVSWIGGIRPDYQGVPTLGGLDVFQVLTNGRHIHVAPMADG